MSKVDGRPFITAGFRRSVWDLLRESATMLNHGRALRKARRYAGSVGLKLNLGCGDNLKPGWVNVDLGKDADLRLDLREPLPFSSCCCSIVYSEHLLEHFHYPESAASFLGECHRVLEKGGCFSVGVPDTEWPLLEYAGVTAAGFFAKAKAEWHPGWCRTEMEHLNFHFRQAGEHHFAYDFKTLESALAGVGFVDIVRRPFDPGLDDPGRELGTLYVAARKP